MAQALKINVPEEKKRIILFLEKLGPSVSTAIAKELNVQSYVASALLSELLYEKALKASAIRVGGSPLYYLDGQEKQLENFTNFMNHKEKEAFELLKKENVLKDSELVPAIRVAIRDVKDFAIPLKVKNENEEILFWKYRFSENAEEKIAQFYKEKKKDNKGNVERTAGSSKDAGMLKTSEGSSLEKPSRKKESDIKKVLENWAEENKITIKEILSAKGSEAKASISLKSNIGELDFLLLLKDKKSISEADLAMACQEGVNNKLPVIFLSSGKISKKSKEYMKNMGKNIIFRKL